MSPGSRIAARLASRGAVLIVVLSGCEAVPSLTFEGQGQGQVDDAGAEGGGTCPVAAPQNATCCGTGNAIPCFGPFCTGANCTTGCDKCAAPEVCCSRSASNVTCLAATAVCK